jgi:ribonuclease HI
MEYIGEVHQQMVRQIQEELEIGVIEKVEQKDCVWISPTFLVPKKRGEWRKVMDCRKLNKFIVNTTFQMEDQRTAALLIERNQYAVSLDIEKAYHHVPVSREMRPYLSFQYSGEYFRYVGMPFGIRNAPRIFTRIMRAAITEVRRRWEITSVQYLDDLLFLHADPTHLLRTVREISVFLRELGWTINWNKSQLTPSRRFVFLGIQWDTTTLKIQIEKERNEMLKREIVKWKKRSLKGKTVRVKQLAKLIGQLSQTRMQHMRASLYLNKLNRLKTQAVCRAGWNATLRMTPWVLGELMWWHTQLRQNKPTLMRIEGKEATIFTDASPQGWGAWLQLEEQQENNRWLIHGVWSQKMIHTSNYNEMMAVYCSLKHFLKVGALHDIDVIRLRTDNTSVMYDVNKRRGATTLLKPLRMILALIDRENLQMTASHVPGLENGIADRLSRLALSGDYQIRQEVFCKGLQELDVRVSVDLFATHKNRQTNKFVSIDNDRQAIGRDAFSMAWGNFFPLIHPPIPLILRCLRKVVEERVRGVVVVPNWLGQPWGHLLQMITEKRVNLGITQDVLIAGDHMTTCGQQLPPGTMIMCLVNGAMKADGECGAK